MLYNSRMETVLLNVVKDLRMLRAAIEIQQPWATEQDGFYRACLRLCCGLEFLYP